MRYDSIPPVFYDAPQTFYDTPNEGSPQPRKHMKYVALKLSEKTLDQKLTLTTDLSAALTTNVAIYATPSPTTTVLTGKATAIIAKRTEMDAAKTALDARTAELSTLELDLDDTLTDEAAYIQKTSGGVEANITLLGLEVKGSPSAPAAPAQVTEVRLTAGDNAGEVKFACKPASGAISYNHHWTTDPTKPETWAFKDSSPGCRTTLSPFTSGTKVWIRSQAVGGKKTGKGPWSDPASITVP